MREFLETWPLEFLGILSLLVFVAFIVGVIGIAVLYIVDVTQTAHAVRRNFPVIGRFRYFFEHLGEFFRQYFFAMDREELPFNRAERAWVYRAAKNVDRTIAFGSTRDLSKNGTIYFVNCGYPTLGEDAMPNHAVTIGPYSEHPYTTDSVINISGMSYGALSKPAVQALSKGAALAGCWMNTGEGGLAPYHLEGGADLVFQIGTAKFGVKDENGQLSEEKLKEIAAHSQVKMFEVKLSQGAKPGKGGIVPAAKVTPEIARIRGLKMGEDAISPNRHPDIANADDLLNMVNHIRQTTGKPVGFKTVVGTYDWLEEMCENIRHRGIESAPDFITIDSADGGTGAAPMSLMDNMGLPLRESLPAVVDMLCRYGLRDRIKIVCSGKLITPIGVAWALCMGADFVTSARGFMFSIGCIQALQCNKNTCPTGVTTHNPKLQRGLVPSDKAVRAASYVQNMNHEIGVIAHACGVPEARLLRRKHARMVLENGTSVPLDELYPEIRNEGVSTIQKIDHL
ncbi:glutamate synthase domain 2 [gamma proteobacterium HTCC5015]|nr:glutamate synthase domain 2 [gamma proteobacterium HTCC5015]